MITLKVGEELIEAVTLACKDDKPVLLVGATGVGKSECLAEVARRNNMQHTVCDLSLMEPPDLTGLPFRRNGKTHYAPPAFLPTGGRCLLTFEELNRCPRYVQAPCFQLLTTRRLNDYRLPPGSRLSAAVNPDDDANYMVDPLDAALMARFMVLHVKAAVKPWLEWADRNGVHDAVRHFVRNAPKIFEPKESNPRAWKYVSDILHTFESASGPFSSNVLPACVAGYVGEKLALAFVRTYRCPDAAGVPSAEEVLYSFRKASPRIRRAATEKDTAFLGGLVHMLLLHLQGPANEAKARSDGTAVKNLMRVQESLPADLRTKLREAHPWLDEKRRRA